MKAAIVCACLVSCASRTRDEPSPIEEYDVTEPADTAPAVPPDTTAPAPTWSIWDGRLKIMTLVARPGPLTSSAPPPPGPAKLQLHPFLSASAHSGIHEDRLRRLLRASTSLEGYLTALRDAGFRIQEEAPMPP